MGRAVQVVRVVEGDDETLSFELDEEALKQVLFQDSVKDLPVVVVSVAGRMRQGKSFLLNYMIKHLKNEGKDTWMQETDVPDEGFQWRDGPDACTTGIHVWSEVFVVHGFSGRRVAVLLMDTQGTFDTNTTMQECSTVFALSTMLSGVQVYNVMRDVKRDDLDSLRLFAEYGKMAQGRGHRDNPFKSLQFLVRDWQWPDHHPLGAAGGADFIKERLKNADGVRSCFEEISCFLLPYPWNMAGGQCFGISGTFLSFLHDFFSNILAWEKLQTRIKCVEGETIKTKDMLTYFKSFVDIFREDEQLPSPQSAFEANVQITLTKAFEIGMKTFDETRKVITGAKIDEQSPSHEPENYEQSLLQCQALAIEEFQSRATLGANHEMSEHYLNRLKEDTETIVCTLVGLNLAKRSNEEAFRKKKESEVEEMLAEQRREETEGARIIAEERLEKAIRDKEEAEKKQRKAERRGEKQDELFHIMKTQADMMLQEAMQDMEEAQRQRREAERMREEADRMREEAEESTRRTGSTTSMIENFRHIFSDIMSAAAPYIPIVLDSFQGRPTSRRRRNRALRQ